MAKYKVLPTWKEVHKDRHRIKYVSGDVGSGKTRGAFTDLYLLGLENAYHGFKTNIFYVIRRTYPQLRDSTLVSFYESFPKANKKNFNWQRMEYIMKISRAHTLIWRFRALDDNIRELEKIGGYIATAFMIDEASEYLEREVMDRCNMRARWPARLTKKDGTEVLARQEVIMVSNPPPSKEHWLWQVFFINNPDPSVFRGWVQPSNENIHNLPPDYYDKLHKSLPIYLRQRYLEGKPVPTPTGAEVYRGFDSDKHVKPITPIEKQPLLRGFDFGTANPACVVAQIVYCDKDHEIVEEPVEGGHLQLRIYDEICYTNLDTREFAKIVKQYCLTKYGYCEYWDFIDPHGVARGETSQNTSFQELVKENIHPVLGVTEIRARILSVQYFLDIEQGLLINPNCQRLIEGFEGGYHKVKIKDVVIDKISKNRTSHPHDALQMITTRYPAIMEEAYKQKTKERIPEQAVRLI